MKKLVEILREFKRVILVAKKPTKEEVLKVAKISALGILIIGFIGFLISIIGRFV